MKRAVVLLSLLVVATLGCGLGKRVLGKQDEIIVGPTMEAAKAQLPGPVLSWPAVPGATLYSVTASYGGKGRWVWVGSETQVTYGSIGGDVAPEFSDFAPLARTTPLQKVQPGKTYRWFVSAFDASGKLLAQSATAEFTP
jgi:hypothetical protein